MNKEDALNIKKELESVLNNLSTIQEQHKLLKESKDNLLVLVDKENKLSSQIYDLIDKSNKIIGDESLLACQKDLTKCASNLEKITSQINDSSRDILKIQNTTDLINKTLEINEKNINEIQNVLQQKLNEIKDIIVSFKEHADSKNGQIFNDIDNLNKKIDNNFKIFEEKTDILNTQMQTLLKKGLMIFGAVGLIIVILLIVLIAR